MTNKSEMKKKKIAVYLASFSAVLILGLMLVVTGVISFNPNNKDDAVIDNDNGGEISSSQKMDETLRATYLENKALNEDYIGELKFTSGLIDTSFVQATDVYRKDGSAYTFYNEDGTVASPLENYTGNDVYIWMYWKTMEYDRLEHGGSVFADCRNSLDDQNYIIYGHHFSDWNDPTHSIAFTPLEQLLEEENYEANKDLDLVLDNEIRHYELAVVYEFNATDDYYNENCQYYRTNYNITYQGEDDEGYYETYIDAIYDNALYDTGVSLTTEDTTLTLQTCISGYTGVLYEICVFKLVSTEYFTD